MQPSLSSLECKALRIFAGPVGFRISTVVYLYLQSAMIIPCAVGPGHKIRCPMQNMTETARRVIMDSSYLW